jgi:hypothetical protein
LSSTRPESDSPLNIWNIEFGQKFFSSFDLTSYLVILSHIYAINSILYWWWIPRGQDSLMYLHIVVIWIIVRFKEMFAWNARFLHM